MSDGAGRARHGILITGTDTGVGKTFASCLLGRRLRQEGLVVRPFKPVESGCLPGTDGRLFPADAAALRDALFPELSLSAVCSYALKAPLSPHLAARLEGLTIDTDRIERTILEDAGERDFVLVEGAGGITVEIREGYSFACLARALSFPVLVVAENRLGVLNQLQLTIRYLEDEGIPLLGVILNDATGDPPPAAEYNAAEVERIAGDRFLGRVAHMASVLPGELFCNFLERSFLEGTLPDRAKVPADYSLHAGPEARSNRT